MVSSELTWLTLLFYHVTYFEPKEFVFVLSFIERTIPAASWLVRPARVNAVSLGSVLEMEYTCKRSLPKSVPKNET